MNHYFLLTIDVEDWFQVENFKEYIPFTSWSSYELRVEKNTHRILDLLDSYYGQRTMDHRHKKTSYQPSAVSSQPQDNLYQTRSHNSKFNTDHGQQSTDPPASQAIALRAGNVPENKTSFRQRRIAISPFYPETEKATKKSKKSSKSCLTTPKATFFVLGWLAERLPNLVREIHSRGHEVASHGYYHNLCNEQSHEDLKTDLCDSKSLLEDIIGNQVYGYRAPSFAINNDILKIIEDCGYFYDSSYNSFAMHGRYGQISVSQNGKKGIALQIPRNRNPDFIGKHATRNTQHEFFYELPISNLHFRTPFSYVLSAISSEQNRGGFVLPWGGGGYFRLIPFPLFKIGVKRILGKENAYLFYFHPWEIDPEQPKVNQASSFYKFRHYTNLNKTYSKLSKLIGSFRHHRFLTCKQYLDVL